MARPSKYNWDAIKDGYEKGLSADELSKKFKATTKHINDKARLDKWQVNSDINNDINEFIATSQKLANNSIHDEINDIIVNKINTQILDNELISNNRKLAKMLQGVIVNERQKINIGNIKQVSSTLKDIETIANPQANRIDTIINNTNATQNNTTLTAEEISIAIAKGLPN